MIKTDWELVDDILKQLSELEIENVDNHYKFEYNLIKAIDNTIFKFTSLSMHLLNNSDNKSIKITYVKMFLTSIANNCLVIKKLFISGWHLQCQSIMRVQYEQLNIVLGILSDDDFFTRFQEIQTVKDEIIGISPKHIDAKKIIREHIIVIFPTLGTLKNRVFC